MARNLKKDYILKIMKMEAPNGYKFDVINYIHNPAYSYDYPSFKKVISEDDTTETIRRVYYFKYYNGTGAYKEEVYTLYKNGEKWQVVNGRKEETLEESNRFNIKKLMSFCL